MDLKLIDNKTGGDLVLKNNDIEMISGFQNMPYLAMFGGNLESNTIKFKEAEQRFDWWGNDLFFFNNKSIQFNSNLERLLNNISLTSQNRLLIIETVKKDLSFMGDFSNYTVDVSYISVDRIQIDIKINELNNLESKEFVYIWDSTKQELE